MPSRKIYALIEKDILSEDEPMQERNDLLTVMEHVHVFAINQNHDSLKAEIMWGLSNI